MAHSHVGRVKKWFSSYLEMICVEEIKILVLASERDRLIISGESCVRIMSESMIAFAAIAANALGDTLKVFDLHAF